MPKRSSTLLLWRSVLISSLSIPGLAAVASAEDLLPPHILMIGDSITFGRGVEVGESYPEIVTEWLGDDYDVTVLGCGGTKSREWTPMATVQGPCRGFFWFLYDEFVVPNLPADVVTILLGTNDSLFNPVVSAEEFRSNLEEMVDDLLNRGTGWVVLMIPPQLPAEASSESRQAIIRYAIEINAICEDWDGVICGPNLVRLLDPLDHFPIRDPQTGARDLHPNALGHEVIAVHLFDTIVRLPEPNAMLLQLSALMGVTALRRVKRCGG